MTAAVDRLDYELVDLLDQDAELGHPSWCDRAKCSVVRESDGSLFGFHESRQVAEVDTNGWNPGGVVLSVAQWCDDTQPVLHLVLATEDMYGLLPLALGDVAPLVDAITAAAKAVSP